MKTKLLGLTVKKFSDGRVDFFATDTTSWQREATRDEMKWAYGELAKKLGEQEGQQELVGQTADASEAPKG